MKTIKVKAECEFEFEWDNEEDDNDENALDGIITEMLPFGADYSWDYKEKQK